MRARMNARGAKWFTATGVNLTSAAALPTSKDGPSTPALLGFVFFSENDLIFSALSNALCAFAFHLTLSFS